MNNTNLISPELKPQIHPKISPDTYEGIYHSSSINKFPAEIYAFCQNEADLQKVLVDLPEKMKNYLDLEFVKATPINGDMFQVEWKNRANAEVQGTLTFTLSPSSHKGTVLIANGIFADYTMGDEEPSDLINLFLKRMKALAETGQLATTKGQPNGEDEKEINKSMKH